MRHLLVAVIIATLVGCAQEKRHLTAEQDAEFAKGCAEQGCVVVPTPIWRQIEKALGLRGS